MTLARRLICLVSLVAVAALTACASARPAPSGSPAASVDIPATPVGERMTWIIDVFEAEDDTTPGAWARVLDENFGTEDYGVGVRKDDTELLGKLDKTLDSMKQDGTAGRIATQWFGANIIK